MLGGADCTTLGFTMGTLRCDARCDYDTSGCATAACGNGMVESGESCDDRNTATGDGLRVVRAAALVGIVLVVGSTGFYLLTGGDYPYLDCLYMTVTTVTTVGYTEVLPVRDSVGTTIFTILVILVGVGAVFYLLTALAAMVVEGDLHQRLWRRRMERRIQNLRDHIIIVL